jgi:hypothetical protein
VEREQWFKLALESTQFCAAYCGDNYLIVSTINGLRTIINVDLSRQDMHIHESGQKMSENFARICNVNIQVLNRLRTKRYNTKIDNGVITAYVEQTQASGSSDTTLNNSSNSDFLLHVVERDFSRGQFDIATSLLPYGHVAVVQVCKHILEADFLQQRFYLALDEWGETTRAPGNKIGRILIKTFWTRENLSDVKMRGLARSIATGLICINNHVPIINDLLKRILEITEGTRPYFDYEMRQKRRWRETTRTTKIRDEHPDALFEIANYLSLDVNRLQLMREHIRSIEWGQTWGSDFTAEFEAFAVWDL